MTQTHDAWEITVRVESPSIEGVCWTGRVLVGHGGVVQDDMSKRLNLMGQELLGGIAKRALKAYYER